MACVRGMRGGGGCRKRARMAAQDATLDPLGTEGGWLRDDGCPAHQE